MFLRNFCVFFCVFLRVFAPLFCVFFACFCVFLHPFLRFHIFCFVFVLSKQMQLGKDL